MIRPLGFDANPDNDIVTLQRACIALSPPSTLVFKPEFEDPLPVDRSWIGKGRFDCDGHRVDPVPVKDVSKT